MVRVVALQLGLLILRSVLSDCRRGLVYDWQVLSPRIFKHRQEYIDHADEPEMANPAKESFDRYHRDSITMLMVSICALCWDWCCSASESPPPCNLTFQQAIDPSQHGDLFPCLVLPSRKFLDRQERVRKILPILKRTYPQARCSLDHCTPSGVDGGDDPLRAIHRRTGEHRHPGPVQEVPDAARGQGPARRNWNGTSAPPAFIATRPRAIRAWPVADRTARRGGAATMDELTDLAGVGRKTANVVLGNAFGHERRASSSIPTSPG